MGIHLVINVPFESLGKEGTVSKRVLNYILWNLFLCKVWGRHLILFSKSISNVLNRIYSVSEHSGLHWSITLAASPEVADTRQSEKFAFPRLSKIKGLSLVKSKQGCLSTENLCPRKFTTMRQMEETSDWPVSTAITRPLFCYQNVVIRLGEATTVPAPGCYTSW